MRQALTAICQMPPPPPPPGWAPGAPLCWGELSEHEAAQLRTSARPDADRFDIWRFLLRTAISRRCPALEALLQLEYHDLASFMRTPAYRDTTWKSADEWLSHLTVFLIDRKTPDGSYFINALSFAEDDEQRSGAMILLRMRDDAIPQDLLSAGAYKQKVDDTAYFDVSMSRREVTAAGARLRRDVARMHVLDTGNDAQLFSLRTLIEKYPRPLFDQERIADLHALDRHIRFDAPLAFTFDDRVNLLAAHAVARRLA